MSIYKDYYEEHANDPDFIKVIRCKDCKHYRRDDIDEENNYCYVTGIETEIDYYCSYGERREE